MYSFYRWMGLVFGMLTVLACQPTRPVLPEELAMPSPQQLFEPMPSISVPVVTETLPLEASYEVDWRNLPVSLAVEAFYRLTNQQGALPNVRNKTVNLKGRFRSQQLRQAIEHQGQLLAIEQGGHWNWSGPQSFWQDYALEVPLVFQQAKSRLTLPMRLAEAGNHNQHATEITSEFSALSVQKLQALLEALPLESDEKLIVLPSLGLVKLFAHPPSQRMVGELIAKINQTAQRQILVEASVVEVELNQAHELGVDWSVVSEKLSLMSQGFTTRAATGGVFQASYQQGGERVFDLGLRALESFGQIKVVSKPQLSVMNHQPALLRVVENLVYFTLDSQVTQNQTTTATQLTSQLHTQPVGFVLFLTPHIQPSGEVLLSLRPSLSMATQSVLDPHPELAKQGIESRVPVIAQREISTLMRLKPGEIGLLGGLIDESAGRDEAHLPGWSKVLGLEASKKKRRELVIFIRVRQSGVLDG